MLGRYRKDVLGRYIQVLSQIFEEFLRKNLEISSIVCIHLIKSKLNILKSLLVYPHQPDSQGNSKIGILIVSRLMVIFFLGKEILWFIPGETSFWSSALAVSMVFLNLHFTKKNLYLIKNLMCLQLYVNLDGWGEECNKKLLSKCNFKKCSKCNLPLF